MTRDEHIDIHAFKYSRTLELRASGLTLLQVYLLQTNKRRGIGFKAMGVTLDMQLLRGLAAGLFTVIFPLSVFMLHAARYQPWEIGALTTSPSTWLPPYNTGCTSDAAHH